MTSALDTGHGPFSGSLFSPMSTFTCTSSLCVALVSRYIFLSESLLSPMSTLPCIFSLPLGYSICISLLVGSTIYNYFIAAVVSIMIELDSGRGPLSGSLFSPMTTFTCMSLLPLNVDNVTHTHAHTGTHAHTHPHSHSHTRTHTHTH